MTIDFDSIDEKNPLFETVTLRERDSTEQLRVPIRDVADVIAKVCISAQDWAGLCKLYPTQEQVRSGTADAGSSDAVSFLRAHQVEKLLNAAVNDAVEKRPADPIKFIAEALLALPR